MANNSNTQYAEYLYDGPVMEFEKIIANRWTGTTYASSEKRARSNLTFRFKKEHGKSTGSKITLPGKIKKVEGEVG